MRRRRPHTVRVPRPQGLPQPRRRVPRRRRQPRGAELDLPHPSLTSLLSVAAPAAAAQEVAQGQSVRQGSEGERAEGARGGDRVGEEHGGEVGGRRGDRQGPSRGDGGSEPARSHTPGPGDEGPGSRKRRKERGKERSESELIVVAFFVLFRTFFDLENLKKNSPSLLTNPPSSPGPRRPRETAPAGTTRRPRPEGRRWSSWRRRCGPLPWRARCAAPPSPPRSRCCC